MGMACVSGWTWPSGSEQRSARLEGRGADGKEKFRRDRHFGDFDPLACWAVAEPDRGQSWCGPQDGPQVHGRGDRGGDAPGWQAVSDERWAELARGWFPELADTRLRQVTWPAIAAHHEFITGQLEAGVTMATVHQRLRDERGLAVSVASFRRYVAANLPEEARRSQVRVLRPDPAEPGAEAQIDYGQLGRWVDPATGRKHVIWAFAMVLACSRHMFVRPVIKLDQHAWTECHVTAFAFFGGVPARLVPDNLKTGVDKPDLYDPKINRSYAEMAAHYGVLVDPARSRKPRDKARIERPMPYIRDSFWRGREWSSLAQIGLPRVFRTGIS